MQAEEFIGKSKFMAQNLAESKNMIFRLISIDGEPYLSYPEDIRDDRVCVELVAGKIVKATIN
jgi:hypothetical protein